jgi:hypothetical protein
MVSPFGPFGASDMKKKSAIFLLACAGVIAMTLGWCFYRNSRITAGYQGVNVGASNEQVLRLLGAPSWVEACGKSFGTLKRNCTEYIYRDSFAPLLPVYYSVSFDTSGHVVDKYVYSSP